MKYNFRWGFACLNINNELNKKKCSDYKVRYCCAKESKSFWRPWTEWSNCDKSCGVGKRKRKRKCANKGHAHCIGQPEQEEECNRQDCPGSKPRISTFILKRGSNKYPRQYKHLTFNNCFFLHFKVQYGFHEWSAWGACSATCKDVFGGGKPYRKRSRTCATETMRHGAGCPDASTNYHLYFEKEDCTLANCPRMLTTFEYLFGI